MTQPVQTVPDLVEEETAVEQKTSLFHGRDVLFKSFLPTQLMQLEHENTAFSTSEDPARKRKAMERIYRIVMSRIPGQEDRDFIADLMADGEITVTDVIRVLFSIFVADDNDAKPAKVTRGRPRRAR